MTYLDWGCDPLREECESCLDALCNACLDEFKRRSGTGGSSGLDGDAEDTVEPDCDHCDLEKKPDCSRCEITLAICQNCGENQTCEFKISG